MFKSRETRTLTESFVKNVALPAADANGAIRQKDYWDALVPSFGVRVSSTGQRSWIVSVRVVRGGKRFATRLALGRYPEMSLALARERAKEAKALAARDIDPRQEQREKREAKTAESRNTFGVLADEFLAKHVEANLGVATGKEYRRALKGSDLARWQERGIADIKKKDVLDVIESLVERGHPVWANRMLAYVRRFFVWCAERDILETLPTDHVRPPSVESGRERALAPAEIPEVWAALEAVEERAREEERQRENAPNRGDGDPRVIYIPLFKVLLLTGQRREEVAGMRWDELRGLGTAKEPGEAPTWELPGERTKNGLPHLVPLAPAVAELIRSVPRIARSPFVFTTTGKAAFNNFSRAREAIDAAIAKARAEAEIEEPMEPWVTHDLRRTMVTRMNEDLGILPHVVEAVVNHVSGAAKRGVAGTYNKAQYLDEKRRALTAWSVLVERLVAGKADNVVQLFGGRSA